MKVVLLQRVEKLGLMGEIVDVKTGYARNYLIPTKKALTCSYVYFNNVFLNRYYTHSYNRYFRLQF